MKKRDDYNAYMRDYMKKRYAKRRIWAVRYLGGKCWQCGSTKNLQIDHIDRTKKKYGMARAFILSEEKLKKEIEKCQLLCEKCHTKKTILERGLRLAKGEHGTLSSYTYCRCEKCRAAKAAYTREYRKTHPRKRTKAP